MADLENNNIQPIELNDINVSPESSWYKNKKKLLIVIGSAVLALIVLVVVIVVLTGGKKCKSKPCDCNPNLPECPKPCSTCDCDPSLPICEKKVNLEYNLDVNHVLLVIVIQQ